jgi:DNA-binding helix-hairpin-helix protein with protein kinase domain
LKTLHDQAAKLKDEAWRVRQAAKQFARDATRKEQAAAAMVFDLTKGDAEVLALERRLACLKGPEKPRLATRLLPLIALGISVFALQIQSRELMVLAILPLAAMFAIDWLVAGVRRWAAARLAHRIERRRSAVLASDAEAQVRLSILHAEAAATKAEALRTQETASAIEQAAAEAEKRYAAVREPQVRSADHYLQEAQARANASRDALATLRAEAAKLHAELQARRAKVNGSRLMLVNLDRAREAELRQLREADRTAQLERFLDQHFVTNAKIDGITPALLAALVSFGIQTAADINATDVGNVPGFGKVRTRRMVDWRNDVARSFRYIPAQAIEPAQRRAIESKYAAGRARVARDLVTARTEIERRIGDLENRIAPVKDAADAAVQALVQARADRRALDFG